MGLALGPVIMGTSTTPKEDESVGTSWMGTITNGEKCLRFNNLPKSRLAYRILM